MSPDRRGWLHVVAFVVTGCVILSGCGSDTDQGGGDATHVSTPTSTIETVADSIETSPTGQSPDTAGSEPDDPTDGAAAAIDPSTAETTGVGPPEAEQTRWRRQDLGKPMADAVLASVISGDTTTLIYPDEAGTFRVMVSADGGPFESHTVNIEGIDPVRGVLAASTPDGMITILSDTETFVPRVLTSIDGIEWSEADATGLDGPADVGFLVATDDGLFAAGALRTSSDPYAGGLVPAMWHSMDGVDWQAVPIPTDVAADVTAPANRSVHGLVGGAAGLVALVGSLAGSTILRSTDGGATWAASTVSMPAGVSLGGVVSVARQGRTMVAVGATAGDALGQQMLTLRSVDDGATWIATVLTDDGPGSLGALGALGGRLATAGDAFWIATRRSSDLFGDGDGCYRDLAACARGSDTVLLRSEAGVAWYEVDLTPLNGEHLGILAIVDQPGGVLVVGTSRTLNGWTWPGDEAPPLLPPRTAPPPLASPLAEFDGTLTVGHVYRFPLNLHCGMGYLGEFNDRFWTVDHSSAPIEPETGAGDEPPADWPVAQQTLFGYITLVEPMTIEYSLPSGEVIAEYHPTNNQPPLCS